jgi:hypothetical protein
MTTERARQHFTLSQSRVAHACDGAALFDEDRRSVVLGRSSIVA